MLSRHGSLRVIDLLSEFQEANYIFDEQSIISNTNNDGASEANLRRLHTLELQHEWFEWPIIGNNDRIDQIQNHNSFVGKILHGLKQI